MSNRIPNALAVPVRRATQPSTPSSSDGDDRDRHDASRRRATVGGRAGSATSTRHEDGARTPVI